MRRSRFLSAVLAAVFLIALVPVGPGIAAARPTLPHSAARFTPSVETTVVVGTDPNYPPFEYMYGGKIVGFDVDLATALLEKAGYNAEFASHPFDGLIPALVGEQIDMIAAAMSISAEREQVIDFSDPYYVVPGTTDAYGFGFRTGDPVRDQVNVALQSLKTEGTYAAIYDKWFGIKPTLSIAAPSTINYGAWIQVSGKLLNAGAPMVGYTVQAESKAYNGTSWKLVGKKTTSATGAYSFSVKPSAKTSYRVRFVLVDADHYLKATSATKTVAVRAYVGNPIAPATVTHNRGFTVYGYLKPRHTSGSKAVRVYAWRYERGRWVSYGYIWAKASNYSTYSKYSVVGAVPYAGKWKLRSYHADAGHAARWSTGYDYMTAK